MLVPDDEVTPHERRDELARAMDVAALGHGVNMSGTGECGTGKGPGLTSLAFADSISATMIARAHSYRSYYYAPTRDVGAKLRADE